MKLEHDPFEMFSWCVAVVAISQGWLRFHHDLLYFFLVGLDSLKAHLGVGTEHAATNYLESERYYSTEGFKI